MCISNDSLSKMILPYSPGSPEPQISLSKASFAH